MVYKLYVGKIYHNAYFNDKTSLEGNLQKIEGTHMNSLLYYKYNFK